MNARRDDPSNKICKLKSCGMVLDLVSYYAFCQFWKHGLILSSIVSCLLCDIEHEFAIGNFFNIIISKNLLSTGRRKMDHHHSSYGMVPIFIFWGCALQNKRHLKQAQANGKPTIFQIIVKPVTKGRINLHAVGYNPVTKSRLV